MVDPAGTRWPSDEAVPGLALLAAEFGCSRLMQLSKTDLFDPGPAPLSGPGHDPVASDASLRAALANERANAEDLRRLIRQQRGQLRRTLVRAALAIDDRGARLAQELGVRQRRVSRRASKLGLIVNALPGRGQLGHRRRDLVESMKRVADPPPFARRVSIIIVTDEALTRVPAVTPGADIEWVIAATGPRAAAPPGCLRGDRPLRSQDGHRRRGLRRGQGQGPGAVLHGRHQRAPRAQLAGTAGSRHRRRRAGGHAPARPPRTCRVGGHAIRPAGPGARPRRGGLGTLGSGGRSPPGGHAGPPGPTRERGRRRVRCLPGGGSGRVRRSRRPGPHQRFRRRGGGSVRPAPSRRRQGHSRALGGRPRSPPGPFRARPVPADRSRQPGLAPRRGSSGSDVAGSGPGRPGHRSTCGSP